MPDPAFRRATPADAGAMVDIGRRVWDELGDGSGFPQRPTAEGLAPLISGERGAAFVCETDGEVCGFALLQPDPGDPQEAVMGVWLRPEARGKGIGTDLAMMATDHARAEGYKKLRGTIPRGNEPALSFFSSIGTLAQVVGQGMEYELPL
jgi:RimJ/RimL family protein N-acetyltransferase